MKDVRCSKALRGEVDELTCMGCILGGVVVDTTF